MMCRMKVWLSRAVCVVGRADDGWEALGMEGIVHVWFDTEYKRVTVRKPCLGVVSEFEIGEE